MSPRVVEGVSSVNELSAQPSLGNKVKCELVILLIETDESRNVLRDVSLTLTLPGPWRQDGILKIVSRLSKPRSSQL